MLGSFKWVILRAYHSVLGAGVVGVGVFFEHVQFLLHGRRDQVVPALLVELGIEKFAAPRPLRCLRPFVMLFPVMVSVFFLLWPLGLPE